MNIEERQELRRQYEAQKQIEDYQIKRILSIPKTNKMMLFGWIVLLLALVVLCIVLGALLLNKLCLRIVIITVLLVVVFESYGRFLGIKAVECYQHYASEETRRRCLCVPSCSEYAILCLKKYGLIRALHKIRKRLYVTCQGSDYVIDWP